jgi:hypothetical protein
MASGAWSSTHKAQEAPCRMSLLPRTRLLCKMNVHHGGRGVGTHREQASRPNSLQSREGEGCLEKHRARTGSPGSPQPLCPSPPGPHHVALD